jgi:hypothetical protein
MIKTRESSNTVGNTCFITTFSATFLTVLTLSPDLRKGKTSETTLWGILVVIIFVQNAWQ